MGRMRPYASKMSRHPRLRHVHTTRTDRSPRVWAPAVLGFLRSPRSLRRNLITYTRPPGLRRYTPWWRMVGVKAGEPTLGVLRWYWAVEEVAYLHGTDSPDPVWFLTTRLRRRRTGEEVTVVTGVFPHAWSKADLVGWSECLRVLAHVWRTNPVPVLLACGWGKDWRWPETRRQFRAVFPGCNATFDGALPDGLPPLVDFTITDLPVRGRHMFRTSPTGQRPGYAEVLVVPRSIAVGTSPLGREAAQPPRPSAGLPTG